MEPLRFETGGFRSRIFFERSFALPRPEGPALYVFDENTHSIFGPGQEGAVVVPAGEEAKSWSSVVRILDGALGRGLSRKGTIVGVGGGVVGDLAAFAASIYMRGCRVWLVPTTLLAMVDAAIGGKTAINFGGYKNMVGTFWPAEQVHVCIESLASLPEREFHSGLAEVIKTAALGDAGLFALLEQEPDRLLFRDPDLLAESIFRCAAVKVGIVQQDLTEQGSRAWLNLGHTFAHALESVAGFGEIAHGEAVAWGMGRAMALGVQLGLTTESYAARLVGLLERYGFRLRMEGLDPRRLIQAMGKDKKKTGSSLRFVLQQDLCKTMLTDVKEEDLEGIIL